MKRFLFLLSIVLFQNAVNADWIGKKNLFGKYKSKIEAGIACADWSNKNDKNYWEKKAKTLMEEKQDQKKVNDKIKQLREKEVEELLFSKYLTKIDNKKKGARTITEFF